MRTSLIERVRSEARMAAERELERLGVDKSRPIDIFKIIQEEGVWLMFQRLDTLYGAYLREGETAGILIHSRHPLSLQRFTAAHEFGHHVLKHGTSLDDAVYIERAMTSSSAEEIAADAFAARFLMPLQLINTVLVSMGLPREPGELTDIQAYRLALDMGVSYSAAVNQLVALKKIRPDVGDLLRKQSPKTIKAKLGRGYSPENSWADVWVLDRANSGKSLNVRVQDELHVSLPEIPSTGYVWMLAGTGVPDLTSENQQQGRLEFATAHQRLISEQAAEVANAQREAAHLALVSDEFESLATNQTRMGKGGTRYLTFRALRSGSFTLLLQKRRPWQGAAAPVETFELPMTILPKPTGETDQGPIEQQKPLAAAA